MKKKIYTILTIATFLLNIPNTSAACTEEMKKEFKKIEHEYTVKYEIDKSTKTYNLYFTSPKSNEYQYKILSTQKCDNIDDKTIKCVGYPSGIYNIEIIGNTVSCNEIVKTINLNLPKYNELSDDPLCEGIEEFVLCSPTYDKEISFEDFASRVETYKRTKKEKNEYQDDLKTEEKENSNNINNELINKILNYIKMYWLEIIIITIFIILVIITIIVQLNSRRKSRWLE